MEQRLYGAPQTAGKHGRRKPDPVQLHIELKKKGVTLELLHLEYLQEHADVYR